VRLRFGELSEAERAIRTELEARIEQMFRAASAAPRSSTWWQRHVRQLWPGLDGERSESGVVVVRPWERELTPVAEHVAARAPAGLDVVSRRPARSFADAASEARGSGIDFAHARARAGFARGHLLEIVVYVPGGTGSTREQELSETLVWDVLGERLADDWIGKVRAAPAPRQGPLRVLESKPDPKQFPLSELGDAVAAAAAGLCAGLADEPFARRDLSGEWTLFELNPEPADDWADEDDLVLATTCVPELLKCHLEKAPFSSVRFSRHEEMFFCLKYLSEGSPEARLLARQTLEDALERALVAKRAGRVVGAGLGLRYAYIHLVLSALDAGLRVVSDVGRSLALPPRSWVLPFDSDLGGEWHEIWAGAPAPPAARRA
jgi:hypothetical protein